MNANTFCGKTLNLTNNCTTIGCNRKIHKGFNTCCRDCFLSEGSSHGYTCNNNNNQNKLICNQCNGNVCNDTTKIYFHHLEQPYGEFCNLYELRNGVIIDNKYFKTVEHYYQSRKFDLNPNIAKRVINANTEEEIFEIVRENNNLTPNDWNDIKINIMLKGLIQKFEQYEYLQNLLLKTGDKIIVKHDKNNTEWGDGGNGLGKNLLGKLLMHIRTYYQN